MERARQICGERDIERYMAREIESEMHKDTGRHDDTWGCRRKDNREELQ